MEEQTRFYWLLAQYTRDPSLIPQNWIIRGSKMLENGSSMYIVVENVITESIADNTMNTSNLNAMGLDVLRNSQLHKSAFTQWQYQT